MGFEVAELLECASPLALWEGAHMVWRCADVTSASKGKRQRTAAVQNLAEVRKGFEVAEVLECARPLAL